MGYKNDRDSQLFVDAQYLALKHLAGNLVHGSERFVHEQDVRVGGEGTGYTHSLTLTAGKFSGITVEHFLIESKDLDQAFNCRSGSILVTAV